MAKHHPASSRGRFARRTIVRTAAVFSNHRGGNVAIIFAVALLPMLLVIGMGLDYTLAGRRHAQLNAIADAAALMTTSPDGMSLSSTTAQTQAIAMFNAQAAAVGGTTVASPSIMVKDLTAANGVTTRTTTVPYSGTSKNTFAGLLNMASIPIGGTSQVSRSNAPNIDFFLLLDTSPSMGIVATADGIAQMTKLTQQQDNGNGCAFACHETNPTSDDVKGNPSGMDNYAVARKANLPLRIDLVQQATSNLIQTAASTQKTNGASYRVATYTFDQSFSTITNLTSNLTQAQSDTANIQMLTVYNNGCLTKSNCNNDMDTQFDSAMAYSAYIPNPGQGTNGSGDSPQEVLFIVTDAVIDEAYPNYGSRDMTDSSNRTITTVGHQTDYCTPLKNRGVRIAILYTTYNPLPNNAFYMSRVSSFQPNIPAALQNCASPGLFFQVDTGGDISTAMVALFTKAVGSAHLVK